VLSCERLRTRNALSPLATLRPLPPAARHDPALPHRRADEGARTAVLAARAPSQALARQHMSSPQAVRGASMLEADEGHGLWRSVKVIARRHRHRLDLADR